MSATLEHLRHAEEAARARMLEFEAPGWHRTERAHSFDCRGNVNAGEAYRLWNRVCSHAAGRHVLRRPTQSLTVDASLDASVVGRLIGRRPVHILGDSHGLDLFCAMSCWLLRSGRDEQHTVEMEVNGTWHAQQSSSKPHLP